MVDFMISCFEEKKKENLELRTFFKCIADAKERDGKFVRLHNEYEKENGEYIEFEIYEDRIEVYSESLINGEEEFVLYGITANDKMKQMVVDFYG